MFLKLLSNRVVIMALLVSLASATGAAGINECGSLEIIWDPQIFVYKSLKILSGEPLSLDYDNGRVKIQQGSIGQGAEIELKIMMKKREEGCSNQSTEICSNQTFYVYVKQEYCGSKAGRIDVREVGIGGATIYGFNSWIQTGSFKSNVGGRVNFFRR